MKVCTRCKKNKYSEDYRVREKRGYTYLNPTCKKCDSEIQSEYYQAHKNDVGFLQKNREKSRQYNKDKQQFIKEKRKHLRSTASYKAYVKKYYTKNRGKILKQHRVIANKYADKQRKEITEQYILMLLTHPREDLGSRDFIRQHPEVIKLYQSHIKFKRLCKRLQTSKD